MTLQRLHAFLQTSGIPFEWLLSAPDQLVAALVARMGQWSRMIGN